MPAADADMKLAMEAAERAGKIALSFFRKKPRWRYKPDHTPVSEADMAVDAALRDFLLSARPDHGWLSEETADDLSRLERPRVWVLDPVDGTRGFLRGDPNWCVSLALVAEGRPVIGVISAPALGKTWRAAEGAGAFLDGAPLRVSNRAELSGARVAGPRYLSDPKRWATPWPEISLVRLPSLALRLAWVASAEADASAAPGYKREWDVAAGDLLIREAGGVVTDARGRRPLYNGRDTRIFGIAAAGKRLHGPVMERMRTYRAPGGRGRRPAGGPFHRGDHER